MANRILPDGTQLSGPTGAAYQADVAAKVGLLFNSIALRPTTITNVGNDYTIVIDPVLSGANPVSPMAFYVRPNVQNTAGVRIRVTGAGSYYALVKANGAAFQSGQFRTDTDYLCVFLDGRFVCLSDSYQTDAVLQQARFIFTASGTLDLTAYKASSAADRLVMVEAWAGGGGGGSSSTAAGGGGGGAGVVDFFRLGDLTNTVAITIGAGGAPGTTGGVGGNTSFGSYLTVYGGGGGKEGSLSTVAGGGGGGVHSAGGTATGSGVPGAGGVGGGGRGGTGATPITDAQAAEWAQGGGGGGSAGSGLTRAGGASLYGGGGGGGSSAGAGGLSKYGGNGGTGSAGVIPGGGGGAGNPGFAGARGEMRIFIL